VVKKSLKQEWRDTLAGSIITEARGEGLRPYYVGSWILGGLVQAGYILAGATFFTMIMCGTYGLGKGLLEMGVPKEFITNSFGCGIILSMVAMMGYILYKGGKKK
jgi:hypothetical protein